jgi:hypothetical protein
MRYKGIALLIFLLLYVHSEAQVVTPPPLPPPPPGYAQRSVATMQSDDTTGSHAIAEAYRNPGDSIKEDSIADTIMKTFNRRVSQNGIVSTTYNNHWILLTGAVLIVILVLVALIRRFWK